MRNVNRTIFQFLVTIGAAPAVFCLAAPPSLAQAESRTTPVKLGGLLSRNAEGPEAFALPRRGMSEALLERFFEGQRLFNLAWVAAPSPTRESDGLGPIFNRVGCGRCHEQNGRGKPPAKGSEALNSAILRLGIPTLTGARPDPVYGRQLQSRAIPGHQPEGYARVHWRFIEGAYADGTPYRLRAPILSVRAPRYGALNSKTRLSLRVASPIFGLDLLQRIPVQQLRAWADPDDRDGDGISGRLSERRTAGEPIIGRFGWKAAQPSLTRQTASAFSQDMGLTTAAFPYRICASPDQKCRRAPHGGQPEVSKAVLASIVFYMRNLAVPNRQKTNREGVVRGDRLFRKIGCGACHRPAVTIPSANGAQTIHPFTDLLLHDMGTGLSDGLQEGSATAREWRTPPLWGLGRTAQVNGNAFYLHDGRARTLAEAILWHGGEGKRARERFRRLTPAERRDLIAFLKSL